MIGPFRLGSGLVRAFLNAAGSRPMGTRAPVPMEGWRWPLTPMAGMVAVPTITTGFGGR